MTNIDKLDLIRNGKPCSLAYCNLTCYPGNVYEPRHRRLVYREVDEAVFVGIAFDADWAEILRVEAPSSFEADDVLTKACNAFFTAEIPA